MGRGRIADILSDPVYKGEYYFNKKCGKSNKPKPRSEWIRIDVEPILDAETFHRVEQIRESRRPENTPPKHVNTPTLLTGLLRCGCCGAGMTLATGKGGRYRYYKCTNRINKGSDACDSGNVPVTKLDNAVLTALAGKLFTPGRVTSMMTELQKRIRRSGSPRDEMLKQLNKDLAEATTGIE